MVLICISLIVSVVEQLFVSVSHLAVFFANCLFKCSDHFFTELLVLGY